LGRADLAANLNLFSKVVSDDNGKLSLSQNNSPAGSKITLRFEMDTLVVLHNCPHPLNKNDVYPQHDIAIDLDVAAPVADDDFCKNACAENQRGFANNALYYLGQDWPIKSYLGQDCSPISSAKEISR
jgi:hypothetical protein